MNIHLARVQKASVDEFRRLLLFVLDDADRAK
jgi:hypothetical protein